MTAALARNADEEGNETGTFTNRPIWKSARFNGVQSSIWPGKDGHSPTVTFDKSYKVGEEYKNTQSFFPDDLPSVNAVTNLALIELARMQQTRSR